MKITNRQIKKHHIWLIDHLRGKRLVLKGKTIKDCDLSNKDLTGIVIEDCELVNVDLTKTILKGVKISNTSFTNVRLNNTDLSNSILENVNLVCEILMAVSLRNTKLKNCDLSYTSILGGDLSGISLYKVDWTYSQIVDVNLEYAFFTQTILDGTTFDSVKLDKARLKGITSTENIEGKKIIEIQCKTIRDNNRIRYWVDDDVIIDRYYEGTLKEFKEKIKKENKEEYYKKVIDFIESQIK